MMKTKLFVLILLLVSLATLAQEKATATLFKDLDGDLINDQVFIDLSEAVMVCKLSTQGFKAIKSKAFDDEANCGIRSTKSGFEFYTSYSRGGYAAQFRYHKTAEQIQLIGMSRYEFGLANNDGSGKSSINILTHSYIGNWNYYDHKKAKLIGIPAIKQSMQFSTTYLTNYSDVVFFKYQDLCAAIFNAYKEKMLVQSSSQTFKKTFIDQLGKNILQVKVDHPCDLQNPPWDAEKCTIEAILTNSKGTISLFYDHPNPQMSLIYFNPKEINTPKINGSTAILIPFYYCGNSEDKDRLVSYIIFYNQKKYIYHLQYECNNTQNCLPKVKLATTLTNLPSPLRNFLTTYLSAKHKDMSSFHQE